MHLTDLSLRNFRNYRELDLELGPGLLLFSGANAQGKSNLLEAVYLLALTRSHRADNEREVVRFGAREEGLAVSRVLGVARRADGRETRVQIDMTLDPSRGTPRSGGAFQKRIRVDGVPRSAAGAIGSIAAVLFSADDLELVTGPPAGRRRYLDVLLSRLDRPYLRSLQRYQRVVSQRNHLLRRIRDGKANAQELGFWDEELATHGARIVLTRRSAVRAIGPDALAAYDRLAPEDGPLCLRYEPTVEAPEDGGAEETAGRLRTRLRDLLPREVQLGQTLAGPHRDDVKLLVGDVDVGQYGSRGQVRTVALALRLAETEHLGRTLGEKPVLLLDDVLSELDGSRQREVLRAALAAEQAILTLTDRHAFPEAAPGAARLYRVQAGTVVPESLYSRAAPDKNGGGTPANGPGGERA